MMIDPSYARIVDHYEECLAAHGDTHLGVDWPNAEDAETRYEVMLEVIRPTAPAHPVTLLDVGCGASHLYHHVQKSNLTGITYFGLDLSEKFVTLSRSKYPENTYWCMDLLSEHAEPIGPFDYAVLNGVFTEKLNLSFDEMFEYLKAMVSRVYELVNVGLAFNVMSAIVDWERSDLFHVPFDRLATWLTSEFGRRFVFRSDYGLYEYTAYLYR